MNDQLTVRASGVALVADKACPTDKVPQFRQRPAVHARMIDVPSQTPLDVPRWSILRFLFRGNRLSFVNRP